MYIEKHFEKFSLALLAQMGDKFSCGDVTLSDARLLCESICEYQMYLAETNESLSSVGAISPSANKQGGCYGG
ncbi:hypothetical protein [Thalassomonas haliotis]|uniref:Uncharacterized protein n=1 Tax=Thalassomonas haliotis TaxID=485448 RepID=A0ABY7VAB0_9GAMM|nr:hypothetical protein [Thalassomonas haliotis]WDE10544.1 hypothetical protein H3N35_20095 [Thalassomonas haliotis]